MLNNNTIKLLLAVVIIGGIGFFLFSASRSQPNVTLEASADKDSYTASDEVNISLTLENEGEEQTCINDLGSGSIVFNTITRDGEQVETRSAPAHYIAPFLRLLEANLTRVDPGADFRIILSSENDPGLGVRTLSTTALKNDTGIVTFYNIAEPGAYIIELTYRYTGPESSACKHVFKGPSNTAEVAFTVTP